MKTLYLAHNFHTRKAIRKWELYLEGKYNIILDNPFYDNDRNDIKALDKLKDKSDAQEEYFKLRNTPAMCELIVEGDLEMIRKSDGLVTILRAPSFGTPMEVFFAARILRIPVYIITRTYASHPWIKKFATKIFVTRKEFEQYLLENYGVKK